MFKSNLVFSSIYSFVTQLSISALELLGNWAIIAELLWSYIFFATANNNFLNLDDSSLESKIEDDCITDCFINYPYFTEKYKLMAIDLSKQHELDADSKAIQQINFIGNLDQVEGKKKCFPFL